MTNDVTMTGTPEYDELLRVQREAKQKIEQAGRSAVSALFRNFFAGNPEVKGVGWTQYTPHFNDGEPCEFGVGSFRYTTEDLDFEDTAVWDEEQGWRDTYDKGKTKREREIREAVGGLYRAVDEDVFEAAFGDHVQIVAVPSGFHVTEYSHD